MRLWSIHPEYLDAAGLSALWREALLAQKVMAGKTKAYLTHPQLDRFKSHPQPISAIGFYLYQVYREAKKRGYRFKKEKIIAVETRIKRIGVSCGQLRYEIRHLASKLKKGAVCRRHLVRGLKKIKPNPLFFIYRCKDAEDWERTDVNG